MSLGDECARVGVDLDEHGRDRGHGEPCFFVRDKRPLCYFHHDHNGDGRISLWCPVPPGVQEEMVSAEPVRFFAPPTSSSGVFRQWLGVYLDTMGLQRIDWDEVAAIIEGAFRHIAPVALVTELDDRSKPGRTRS